MAFLSIQALSPLTPYLLFVQPYKEAGNNFALAFGAKGAAAGRRIKHLLVGLTLSIPVINTIALLILRSFCNSPVIDPRAKKSFQNSPVIDPLTKKFIDHIFDVHTKRKIKNDFTLSVEPDNTLLVKFQQGKTVKLSEILEQINWSNLDKKWQSLDPMDIKKYLDSSLIFGELKSATSSPFQERGPFIKLYTSHGFYSWLNPLLRSGTLRSGLLTYAASDVNTEFMNKKEEMVDLVAKELLFICFATSASLQALPKAYEAKCKVVRMAHIPKQNFEEMMQNDEIIEKGFMSAAAPGGCFAGGGPGGDESVRVKFVIQSKKGLYVNEFSDLPENEVLFKPFTRFKVLKRSGSQENGFRIELEEAI